MYCNSMIVIEYFKSNRLESFTWIIEVLELIWRISDWQVVQYNESISFFKYNKDLKFKFFNGSLSLYGLLRVVVYEVKMICCY